jgi:quercetin dioxygenase-like cupin family protein
MTDQPAMSRRSVLTAFSTAGLALWGDPASHRHSRPTQQGHRRIVTGVNARGRSVVVSDSFVPESATSSSPGKSLSSDLWVLKHVPVSLSDTADPVVGYTRQSWPPSGGVIARVITWQPGVSFPSHRSATVDFIFVISGRLELVLEEGSVILQPGDSAVQRGTEHGWRVAGEEACTFAAVLIDATPPA